MPLGLLCLNNPDRSQDSISREQLIDIVAVHGSGEDSVDAWTDPTTGINWLRDFVPKHIHEARVLTYGYDASALSFFGSGAAVNIQRTAECLVQELYANRKLEGMRKRPIVFVCHGLGGVLVKKSLVYSSTRTAIKVDHLWDQYVSTFAVLFLGTPHGVTSKSRWTVYEAFLGASGQHREATALLRQAEIERPSNLTLQSEGTKLNRFPDNGEDDLQFFKAITGEFMPLMRQFRLFFFWEELKTEFESGAAFVVDHSSAVLDLDNTEKAGIHATHNEMVKFRHPTSSSFRTIIEALSRYCGDASTVISHRWNQAIPALQRLRAGEAYELGGLGFDVHVGEQFRHQQNTVCETTLRHFYPPQEARPDFVGRQDMLQKAYNAFFPNEIPQASKKRKSFVVYGMGGSGKTQFCSKFAMDWKNRYTAVFTIHAASTESINDSFSKIGKAGGLEATESAGRHFLSQLDEPWLLIIDNADDPTLDLQSLFPLQHTSHILVTTRNPIFRKEGTLGKLELKGLKEEEALQLLLRRADIPRPWDVTTERAGLQIANTLGYLALALIHAGTCIYRGICRLGDYLDLHSTSRSLLRQRRSSSPKRKQESPQEADMVHIVYSTFDISLDFLLQKQTVRSQDASELLKIVCFYHSDSIPVEIFTRAVTNRRGSISRPSDESWSSRLQDVIISRLDPPKPFPRFLKDRIEELDKYRVMWAISELQSLSLINYDSKGGSFSLHPLVHAWVRDSFSASERQIWASISLNTLLESVSLPSKGRSEADGDFHGEILPHLDACLQHHGVPLDPFCVSSMSQYQVKLAKICRPTMFLILRDRILSAAKCGYVFADRGQFRKAVEHLLVVKNTLIKTLGYENEKTMSAMLGVAGVFWGLCRLEEALALQRKVVDTRARIYGSKDARTLQAVDQLGRSHWQHGQYQEALALQEPLTKHMKATMGYKHPQTLAALDNFGVTLQSSYRFEEALKIHQHVSNVREKTLGETHLDTLETKAHLAMALLDLKRFDEAKAFMNTVHTQREQQLGKEHPWTLWALCYLAKIHIEMGLLQDAEEMLTWGCEAGERSLSKDHIGVLMGRGELARTYARQGNLEAAEKLSSETMELLEASRGIAHPDVVYGLFKLAQLYELKGDRQKAAQICQVALERADMRITRDHPLAQRIEALLQSLHASDCSSVPKPIPISQEESQHSRYARMIERKTW